VIAIPAHAAVPQLINHQGRIAVNGTNFEGTGQFKFALVNATGSTTYWSNDNTSSAGSEPTAAVSLPVVKGLYAVLLGDTGMTALPTTVFDNADVRLRVWFNDGTFGFQQITPDQRLASAPYALNAAKAESVPDASITSAKLASGLTLTGTTTGTFSGPLTGNASSATSAASATNFTGSLLGDVTGTQSATAISAATITGKTITGFVSGAGAVTATDTLLSALNKLDGNIGLRAPLASPTFTGTVTGTFSGNGSALTNLNGSNISTGTVADARLSANVALLNRAAQNFSGTTNSFAGNVGIGTTSPSTRLHVFHSGSALPASSGNTQSAGLIARLRDGGNIVLDIGGFGGSGYWLQSSDPNNLANTYPMLLNPIGGNVGIGTTSPSARLHVNGTARFNSTITLSAGTSTVPSLILQGGANLTTPVFGAVEFDGTSLYLTNNSGTPTRKTLAFTDSTISGSQIANGSITSAQLASNLTLGGTTTGTFVGDGSGLTGLNASQVLLEDIIAPPIRPVVAWGDNDDGQTSVPTTLINANTAAIAAGGSVGVALLKTGTVEQWGAGTPVPGGLVNVTHIAAGTDHRLARKSDGTVIAWGDNTFGQSTVPGGLTTATNIAAGEKHSLALRADGSVLAWGDNSFNQTTVPGTATNVTAIAAGYDHSLALKADGTVVAWGRNDSGQSTVPEGLTNVVAIASGAFHSLAVKSDGTVVAWGWDTGGQVGGATGLTGISKVAGGYAFSLALKNDGTLISWGDNTDGQTVIPAAAVNVTAIAAGPSHALALRADLIPAQVARLDQDNVFTGRVGIKRTAAANTLEVEGQASKVTAGNWLANSDRRIKDNVKPITGALEKLSQVRLVDFNYTADYRAAHPGIEDKRYLNVIAQDFAEVFPDDVKSSGEKLPDGSPILQVDTYPLTIYSAAAVQELAKENEQLKKQLAEQELRLKKLEALIK